MARKSFVNDRPDSNRTPLLRSTKLGFDPKHSGLVRNVAWACQGHQLSVLGLDLPELLDCRIEPIE